VVTALLLLYAVAKVLTAAGVVLDHNRIRGFSEWATVISEMVSGAFILVGVFRLPRSRLDAYVWFDRGLLVEILITQVFVFDQEQLAGILGLSVSIAIWLMVRGAIRAERERAAHTQFESETLGSPSVAPNVVS
jgi:hypothetical protein